LAPKIDGQDQLTHLLSLLITALEFEY